MPVHPVALAAAPAPAMPLAAGLSTQVGVVSPIAVTGRAGAHCAARAVASVGPGLIGAADVANTARSPRARRRDCFGRCQKLLA